MTGIVRTASCRCGQLRAEANGDPVRISVCHCLDCKRRSGSAFSWQARWPDANVTITGEARIWHSTGDSGGTASFRICPECGSTIAFTISALPGMTAIPVGAFADPHFPAPTFSVYESRKCAWLDLMGDDLEHD